MTRGAIMVILKPVVEAIIQQRSIPLEPSNGADDIAMWHRTKCSLVDIYYEILEAELQNMFRRAFPTLAMTTASNSFAFNQLVIALLSLRPTPHVNTATANSILGLEKDASYEETTRRIDAYSSPGTSVRFHILIRIPRSCADQVSFHFAHRALF